MFGGYSAIGFFLELNFNRLHNPRQGVILMSEDTTQLLPGDGLQLILSRLDSLNAHLNSIDARLTTLEEKVDRRLQETRPIWEQVLTRLDGIENRLDGLESELQSLNRKFRVFYDDILKLQDKREDLEERVRKLEPTQ
jgi:chromosome segregation ATPase